MAQSPAALRGAAKEYRLSLGQDGAMLAGRMDDAAATIEGLEAQARKDAQSIKELLEYAEKLRTALWPFAMKGLGDSSVCADDFRRAAKVYPDAHHDARP